MANTGQTGRVYGAAEVESGQTDTLKGCFMLSSYPRAIIHVDADAFFASVEQAMTPSLKGKPVVTGSERNIIACASYEAKALGIGRGMPLFEAKRICPALVVLPSDYETYSLCSKRMFNIIRRYTPIVEEYSIDEAFADITGMRRVFRASYEEIAARIQQDIKRQLDITVSIGLSLSKLLAKLGSKFRKPAGFTAIPGRYIHLFLQKTPLDKVWGFGPNTVNLLAKYGLRTAYDFAARPQSWADRLLHKPGRDIWNELRGNTAFPVVTREKSSYGTIMKSKTFTPASSDKAYVHARLIRNAESAFMKLRRFNLRAATVTVVLRHADFRHDGLEAQFTRPTSATMEALPLVSSLYDEVYKPGCPYRATMVILGKLEDDRTEQYDLFTERLRIESMRKISRTVDHINSMFGKHTVRSAATLFLNGPIKNDREIKPGRRSLSFSGETTRRRLAIPRMDVVV